MEKGVIGAFMSSYALWQLFYLFNIGVACDKEAMCIIILNSEQRTVSVMMHGYDTCIEFDTYLIRVSNTTHIRYVNTFILKIIGYDM